MRRKQSLILGFCLLFSVALSADKNTIAGDGAKAPPTLEETRVMMGKWIETQQIISKERKDWQQGKEILQGRLDLVMKEITSLNDKIALALPNILDADKKQKELLTEDDQLKAVAAQLTEVVVKMEAEVRRLFKMAPEPIQSIDTLRKLYDRIPTDPNTTKVAVAERFQNVIGILNELNKANNEITHSVEFRDLAGGKTQVDVIYVGLSQAYYVSARGEAGTGRPAPDGWKWEPSQAVSRDVLTALEILQGKRSPAFVPLPAKIQ